jgi:copper chaperone
VDLELGRVVVASTETVDALKEAIDEAGYKVVSAKAA